MDMLYFPHVVRFSVAIEATIFRIERRAIEAQRLQSIFTFYEITSLNPSSPLLTPLNPSYLMVKADYKLYKINFDDIHYIEGQHE